MSDNIEKLDTEKPVGIPESEDSPITEELGEIGLTATTEPETIPSSSTEISHPTSEDIKKAEETMTDLQAELSESRARQSELLKELGVTGYLEYEGAFSSYSEERARHNSKFGTITGRINGKRVYIENKAKYEEGDDGHRHPNFELPGECLGLVNNEDINSKTAKMIWDKYLAIAQLMDSEKIKKAYWDMLNEDKLNSVPAKDRKLVEDIL